MIISGSTHSFLNCIGMLLTIRIMLLCAFSPFQVPVFRYQQFRKKLFCSVLFCSVLFQSTSLKFFYLIGGACAMSERLLISEIFLKNTLDDRGSWSTCRNAAACCYSRGHRAGVGVAKMCINRRVVPHSGRFIGCRNISDNR